MKSRSLLARLHKGDASASLALNARPLACHAADCTVLAARGENVQYGKPARTPVLRVIQAASLTDEAHLHSQALRIMRALRDALALPVQR